MLTESMPQLVFVLKLIMKMLIPVDVKHVQPNVLLVSLPLIVSLVLKTESTNQNVIVLMVFMMLVKLNVYHVTGDV